VAGERWSRPARATIKPPSLLAEDAVSRVSASDFLWNHGERLVELAEIHTLAGRRGDALAALAQADTLYERKGCSAALQWTAARRAALSDSSCTGSAG
jgi:hypothetical protein